MEGREGLAGRSPGSPRTGSVEPARLYAYLLDVDDELAGELDVRMRLSARHMATAKILDAECGECDLSPWFDLVGDGPGLLVVDGLLALDTDVAGRTATELLGPGDLITPLLLRDDEMVAQRASWRTLQGAKLALLDGEFLERTRPWPQITKALLRRAERRGDEVAALRVISCQPRLELRLVLLLWHLGTRWGRVEPTGLRLRLPLTHRLLGQLVAAERPSVSHALARLTNAGLVTGSTSDLHLHGSLEEHLSSLASSTPHRPAIHPPRRMTPRHRIS